MDNKEVKTDITKENAPNIEIPKIAQQEEQADFSKIFNIASEENIEVPKKKNESVPEVPDESNEPETPKIVEKKPSEFNGVEKVLYEIKPERESSPVVPALFFAILITAIFLLPYVSEHYDFSFINPNANKQPVATEETDKFFYFDKSSVRAKMGDLEFTNFVKSYDKSRDEYRVSFVISNTALRTYQFDDKYYLVLYDEKENVVFRSIIHSYEAIGALAAKSITLIVNENGFNKSDRFKIEEIPVSTYPSVNLIEKEGEYDVMNCNYKNNTIKYYFKEDKLVKINDVYQENKINNVNYEADKTKYKSLSDKYKTVPNFNSIFIETNVDFQMINEFELKDITDSQISSLQTYRFFKYNETKDIISFELESQAYTCS